MSITKINVNSINNEHFYDRAFYDFSGTFTNEINNTSKVQSEYNREGSATLHLQHFFIYVGFVIFLMYVILLIRSKK